MRSGMQGIPRASHLSQEWSLSEWTAQLQRPKTKHVTYLGVPRQCSQTRLPLQYVHRKLNKEARRHSLTKLQRRRYHATIMSQLWRAIDKSQQYDRGHSCRHVNGVTTLWRQKQGNRDGWKGAAHTSSKEGGRQTVIKQTIQNGV